MAILKMAPAIVVSLLPLLLASQLAAQPREMTVTVETLIGPGIPLSFSDGISLDGQGNLLASDALGPGNVSNPQGTSVRKIAPDLTVTTFVSGMAIPMGNAVATDGTVYVANYFGPIYAVSPSGQASVFANISGCSGVVLDSAGNLFTTRPHSVTSMNQIVKITPAGAVSIYHAGEPLHGCIGLAIDAADILYVANFDDGQIHMIDPANPGEVELVATIPGAVFGAIGFMAYRDGRLYCPGYHMCRVYMVEVETGAVTVLAGTGVPGRVDGPGETARFYQPNGVAVSVTGDTLYITDDIDRTLRILILDEEPTGIEAGPAPTLALIQWSAPNPFRTATEISYELPRGEQVELGIYDVRGRLVRVLFAGAQDAGRHRIEWDGTDQRGRELGNGHYFYTLRAGDHTGTGRLLRLQ